MARVHRLRNEADSSRSTTCTLRNINNVRSKQVRLGKVTQYSHNSQCGRQGEQKETAHNSRKQTRYSYACSWESYIDGNIVSSTSHRFIQNFLAATAASKTEDSENSSNDSDDEQWQDLPGAEAGMHLVRDTLAGISKRSEDEGVKAMGRHARTIRMGRRLWESPPLEAHVQSLIEERFFDDGSFPPLKDVKAAVSAAKNPTEARPAPFRGKTLPSATLTTIAYGERLSTWLARVQVEDEAPTTEQMAVLQRVTERVLEEFRLEHEGLLLPKSHPERTKAEQPLLGFVHGAPGTGKSRVIRWVTRMFEEALG